MNRIHFLFLVAACALGYAAIHHAGKASASFGREVGAGGFDRFQEKAKVSDETLAKGGSILTDVVERLDGKKLHEVSAPVDSSAIHDELRGEIDALKSRVGVLESRKECTCQPVVAAPAAPAAVAPVYSNDCANGNCPTGGRRRGRWFGN